MKKISSLILIIVSMLLSDCKNNPEDSSSGLSIKGNFSGGIHAKMDWFDRIISKLLPSAYALTVSEVSKILILPADNMWGDYIIANVKDESFSANVEKYRKGPIGIIFVGADDSFKGYLTLSGNIDAIPLSVIDDQTKVVDFETLSSNGLIVEPVNNPIGTDEESEIQISSSTQQTLSISDDLFSVILKNPDINQNGKIDLLENKYFRIGGEYCITSATFNENMTATFNIPAVISSYRITFEATDTDYPSSINLKGPSFDSDNIRYWTNTESHMNKVKHCYGWDFSSGLPITGEYVFNYNGKNVSFTFPDNSLISNSIILIVPTVTLNSDGTINKISWVYKNGAGNEIPEPKAIICQKDFTLSIFNSSGDRVYLKQISLDLNEFILEDQTIPWTSVHFFGILYHDAYGSNYGYNIIR